MCAYINNLDNEPTKFFCNILAWHDIYVSGPQNYIAFPTSIYRLLFSLAIAQVMIRCLFACSITSFPQRINAQQQQDQRILLVPSQACARPSLVIISSMLLSAAAKSFQQSSAQAPSRLGTCAHMRASLQLCIYTESRSSLMDGYDAGTALVAAMFLPNVEFIFGLAGSTASVLIAYILPAAIFLIASSSPKAPTGTLVSIQSPSHQYGIAAHAAHSQHLSSESQPVKEGAPSQLSPRGLKGPRRKAWGLLIFGVVVAVVCTHATLTAVQQEAEVVQLAQELAASEAAVSFPASCHHALSAKCCRL